MSPYGNTSGWDLISVIVKAGDDLRQEQLAMQIINSIHEVYLFHCIVLLRIICFKANITLGSWVRIFRFDFGLTWCSLRALMLV